MNSRRFTLIELMFVIGILSVLSVVVVPKISLMKTNAKNSGVMTNYRLVEGIIMSSIESYDINNYIYFEEELEYKMNSFVNPYTKEVGVKNISNDKTLRGAIIYSEEDDFLNNENQFVSYFKSLSSEITNGTISISVYENEQQEVSVILLAFDNNGHIIKKNKITSSGYDNVVSDDTDTGNNGGDNSGGNGGNEIENPTITETPIPTSAPEGENTYTQIYDNNNRLIYEGGMKNGLYDGYGKFYNQNSTLIYAGEWKEGKHNGYGKLFNQNGGLIYEGSFNSGLYNGYGRLYDQNNRLSYDGNFKNNLRDGQGTFYDQNGRLNYVGEWSNDKRNGIGTSYDQNGSITYHGKWVNDIPTK